MSIKRRKIFQNLQTIFVTYFVAFRSERDYAVKTGLKLIQQGRSESC
jgi:hypothetical protein